MKNEKVGQILKRQGELLSTSKKVTKLFQLSIPDETRVIDRLLIVKSYNTMQNEVQKNYTNPYLSTLYNLLSLNEKRYYIKRNRLSFQTYKQFNRDYYNKERFLSSDTPLMNLDPNQYPMQSTEPNRNMTLMSDRHKKPHGIEKKATWNGNKINVLKGLSTENVQLLQIINKSDNYIQTQREHYKGQVLKRIMKIKEYIPVSTPIKLKEFDRKFVLKNKRKESAGNLTTINFERKHHKAISKLLLC